MSVTHKTNPFLTKLRNSAVAALILGAAMFPGDSKAQSLDIGLNFAEVSAWSGHGETSGATNAFRLTGDFRVAPFIGIQGDVGGEMIGGSLLGQVDLHLYLAPQEDRKYGFYASLADMDDRSLTVSHAGIEAMYQIGERTILEGRAGMGILTGLRYDSDFITVTGSVSHAVGKRTRLFATLTLAEFEETHFAATTYDATVGLRHAFGDGRLEVTAAVSQSGSYGRDSGPKETLAILGVTWRFSGPANKGVVAQRAFGNWQPARSSTVLARF